MRGAHSDCPGPRGNPSGDSHLHGLDIFQKIGYVETQPLQGVDAMRPLFSMPIKSLLGGEPSVGKLPDIAECGTLFVNVLTDELEYYPQNAGLTGIKAEFGYYVQSCSWLLASNKRLAAYITFVAAGGAPQVLDDRHILAVEAYARRNSAVSWRGLSLGHVRHTAQVHISGWIDHQPLCVDTALLPDVTGKSALVMFFATGQRARAFFGEVCRVKTSQTRLPLADLSGWQIASVQKPIFVEGWHLLTLHMVRLDGQETGMVRLLAQNLCGEILFRAVDSTPQPLGERGIPLGPIDDKKGGFLFVDVYGEPAIVPTSVVAKEWERDVRDQLAA